MSDTFINYPKQCKETIGGVKRVYLLPYIEYAETLIKSEGMNLTVFPESTIYKFECTGNYTQSSTLQSGNVQFSHQVNIQLSKVYNFLDIHTFIRNDFRVIVETNNGDLIMFGTNNGLVCTLSNASGNSKGEFNGFNCTFDGIEEKTGLLINDLDDFFEVNPDDEGIYFNYTLNFDIH